jgi:hypothetical protein
MLYPIKKETLIVFALFLSLFFYHCRENQDIIQDDNERPTLISSGVIGRVIDPSGSPLENVEVSFDQTVVQTDKDGVFILKDQLMNKQGAHIKFRKSGFYVVYRTVVPVKGQVVRLETQLIRRSLTQTIQSAQGGPVETNGNASVVFQANSFLDAQSQPYSGNVRVFSYYMDPLADQTLLEMPGNLTGRDEDGKFVILRTMGMLKVELEDENGNPLKLNPDHPAEMKVPIPASLQSKAEENIPLWYFDQLKGTWIEEGKAKKNGNYYVGAASHFTFWNWDFPFTPVQLKFRLVDASGKPVSNLPFDIRDLSNWGHGGGATNDDGTFEAMIPANGNFEMREVQCNSILKNFQTLNADLDLGDLVVPDVLKTFNLSLKAVDCNGQAVSNGYLSLIHSNGNEIDYFPLNNDGSLNLNLSYCSGTAYEAKIVDAVNLKERSDIEFDVSNQTLVDLGELRICDELENYLKIKYLGNEYLLDARRTSDSTSNPLKKLDIYSFGYDSLWVLIQIDDMNQPNGKPSYFSLDGLNSVYLNCFSNCDNVSYHITHLGPVGGRIRGTFTGSLLNQRPSGPQGMIQFDGEFSVKRD